MILKLLVPLAIIAVVMAIIKYYQYKQWQDELRHDKEKAKYFDRLLSDDPACENEDVLHPGKWDKFRSSNEMKIV